MYTGNRCGSGLNFYPNVYTLVREEVSASVGDTHIRIYTYTQIHTWANGHIDKHAWVRGWILPLPSSSFSLFLSLSLSFLLFLSLVARGSGKTRIRSAVNLKINIDRGAANPLFIDADCWLHGRDAPRKLLLSPSYPSYSIPPGFRCHVVPNASWIMRSSSLQSLFRPSCYSPLRLDNENCSRKRTNIPDVQYFATLIAILTTVR